MKQEGAAGGGPVGGSPGPVVHGGLRDGHGVVSQ